MTLDLEPLTERIIACGIEVHRDLGPGLLESAYQEAMRVELRASRLTFLAQPLIAVRYKNHVVGDFRPDFIVAGQVVLELKCVARLDPIFHAQVLTYLRATGLHVGLLMNFHAVTLRAGLKRFVL